MTELHCAMLLLSPRAMMSAALLVLSMLMVLWQAGK